MKTISHSEKIYTATRWNESEGKLYVLYFLTLLPMNFKKIFFKKRDFSTAKSAPQLQRSNTLQQNTPIYNYNILIINNIYICVCKIFCFKNSNFLLERVGARRFLLDQFFFVGSLFYCSNNVKKLIIN